MSVLWDTSRLQGTTDILMPGDTITDIFWNAVNQRGSQLMMREKNLASGKAGIGNKRVKPSAKSAWA